MNVADYIIGKIADLGIDKCFVVYGAANGDLIDAFTRNDKTDYVACMHEQGAGYAAEGYAKVKGIPGCAIATSGPGGQNLLTSMGNCFYDSVPCIFLTGQVKREFMRKDDRVRQLGFQECEIVTMAAPVTKMAVMINRIEDVRQQVERALWICRTGRPGPVLLDLPLDLQKLEFDPSKYDGYDILAEDPGPHLDQIDEFVSNLIDGLLSAERPVVLVGGGVHSSKAVDAMRLVLRYLLIPAYPTWNAIDIVTDDDFWCGGRVGTYGGKGRNFGIQNCDLLLAVGSRISGRITGGKPSTFARAAKKYLVDIDPVMCLTQNQEVPFDFSLAADAGLFLARFLKAITERIKDYDRTAWMAQCRRWHHQYDPVSINQTAPEGQAHPYSFIRTLSRMLPSNAIVVGDCGGNIVTMMHSFESKPGQRLFTNNGNSPMGFSFAAAIGAWFADPSRPVICIIGDGGMCMNIQEVQTLVNYGANVKTFIINNKIYGITKAFQKTNFQGRAEACGPKGYAPPDFMKLADAYGVFKYPGCIDRSDILNVMKWPGSVIADVPCHEFHTYEPRIVGWQTPIEDMYPYLPREELKENMTIPTLPISEDPPKPQVI